MLIEEQQQAQSKILMVTASLLDTLAAEITMRDLNLSK